MANFHVLVDWHSKIARAVQCTKGNTNLAGHYEVYGLPSGLGLDQRNGKDITIAWLDHSILVQNFGLLGQKKKKKKY